MAWKRKKAVGLLILVLLLFFLFNNWKQYLRYVNLGRTRPSRTELRKRVQKEKTISEMLPNTEMRKLNTSQLEIKSENVPNNGKENMEISQEETVLRMLPNTVLAKFNREISQEISQFETLASNLRNETMTILMSHQPEPMSETLSNSNVKNGKIAQEKVPEKSSNVRKRSQVIHLYFLRMHKAGSTTIQNLFYRFAMKHGLNALIPVHRGTTYPLRTFDQYLPKPPPSGLQSGKYDVHCEHSIYSEQCLMTQLHKDTMNMMCIVNIVSIVNNAS